MRTAIWSGSLLNDGQIIIMRINKPWIFLIKNALQMSHCRGFITQFLNSINYTVCTMSLIFHTNQSGWKFAMLFSAGIPFPIIVAWAIGKLYYDNEKWVSPMLRLSSIFFLFYLCIIPVCYSKHTNRLTSFTIKAIKG